MGRIGNEDLYNVDNVVTRDDYVIGTDYNSSFKTKNYKIGDILDLVEPIAVASITATQVEVDAGVEPSKFISPLTFANAAKWNTKANTVHTHVASDVTNFNTAAQSAVVVQTITNGDTTHAPSGDVLFDKLLLKQNLPTGFVAGLTLSIHPTDNTKAIIAPGGYIITDFSDVFNVTAVPIQVTSPIEFTPAFLNTSPSTYVALDINMNIVSSASPFDNDDRRTLCLIGNVVHSNNVNINIVNEIKAPILAPTNQLHDLIKAVGFLNLEGNQFSANGANLSLNKTAGKIWGLGINGGDYLDPHRLTLGGLTAATFRYRLSNSLEFSDTTFLNPTQYESSPGVLTTLSNNNRWSIQHLNIFQSGAIRIQPGQHEYNSFTLARNAAFTESFTTEQNIADNAIFRCLIIMQKTCTDLQSAITAGDAEIIHIGKFGNAVGGSTAALTFANIIAVLGYTPENVANKQDSLAVDGTGVKYPTVDAVNSGLSTKQATLVSGTNIKTINGNSLLGSGDLSLSLTVSPKIRTLTSSDLQYQNIEGFLIYVNALSPNLVIASNEQYDFHVTDTNQIFSLKKSGVTVGLGQTAVLNSEVLEYRISDVFNPTNFAKWRFLKVEAVGNNTTTLSSTGGMTLIFTVGTNVTKTSIYSTGNFIDTVRRLGAVSSASAGSSIQRTTSSGVTCSTLSGFYGCWGVICEDAATVANRRSLAGLGSAFASPIGNVDPSTQTSCFIFGKDSSDTNMQVMHNDNAGSCTKIDLGVNFPGGTLSTDLYIFETYAPINANRIFWQVTRRNTGHVVQGVATTNIPATNIPLTPCIWANNGSTALAVTQSLTEIAIATPY